VSNRYLSHHFHIHLRKLTAILQTASTAIGQAIKATKATKQARNAKEVSASSDEPKVMVLLSNVHISSLIVILQNPFRGLPHPTKVCKDGVVRLLQFSSLL